MQQQNKNNFMGFDTIEINLVLLVLTEHPVVQDMSGMSDNNQNKTG